MTRAIELFAALPAGRVLELPRPRSPRHGDGGTDVGRRLRLAGIVAAYHGGQRLLLGWHRPAAGRPVEVFAAGGVVGEPDPCGRAPMSFPPGATGLAYPAGELLAGLRAVPAWTRLAGLVDGLLLDGLPADDATPREEDGHPSLDECLLHVWHAGFAWFVLAEPVPATEIAAIAGRLADEERQAQSRAQSPEHAVAATRLQRRHRELQQGRSTGMWRVHLLAGAASPAAAASVAGLICASADLGRQPYALAPTGVIGDLGKILALDQVPDSPVLASSALLASLAVTPVEEVPGPRLAMRSEFDVTPEATALGPGSLALGVVLDRTQNPAGQLELSRDSLKQKLDTIRTRQQARQDAEQPEEQRTADAKDAPASARKDKAKTRLDDTRLPQQRTKKRRLLRV